MKIIRNDLDSPGDANWKWSLCATNVYLCPNVPSISIGPTFTDVYLCPHVPLMCPTFTNVYLYPSGPLPKCVLILLIKFVPQGALRPQCALILIIYIYTPIWSTGAEQQVTEELVTSKLATPGLCILSLVNFLPGSNVSNIRMKSAMLNIWLVFIDLWRHVRSSPSVPVAVSDIQNHKQKNLRGGTHATRLVISRGA